MSYSYYFFGCILQTKLVARSFNIEPMTTYICDIHVQDIVELYTPIIPVITHPTRLVSGNRCVTDMGSSNRSGTLRCAATTAASAPRRATDVRPPWFMALRAYSETKDFKSVDKYLYDFHHLDCSSCRCRAINGILKKGEVSYTYMT